MCNQTARLSFTWNRSRMTERENQMFGALLEVFLMGAVNQVQVRAERSQATAADGAEGIRLTLEWARLRFPDLNVDFEP